MNTVAWPATWLPGSLVRATSMSMAASYCSGPSSSSSGARSLAMRVASMTFSTSAPLPDEPVEYDSMATRGSMPKMRAVWAELMAISASCSAVGLGFTAQSPKASTRSFRHIRNTLDTMEKPGLVLMNSNAGRMVCAVVLMEPETMPSASPLCTIMVPK